MEICIVFGTRPEFIKIAPLIEEIRKSSLEQSHTIVVISSGQHENLLRDALEAFDVDIDVNFELMLPNQSSGDFMSRAMAKFNDYFKLHEVALVVVHGDTGTAAAAAISAHHHKIPIAHVEAGLRSGDLLAPWPEESNRRIIDTLATLHFAPTSDALLNLVNEGHSNSAFVTGNTVVDAIQVTSKRIVEGSLFVSRIIRDIVEASVEPIILATQHRRENFGEPLENVLRALNHLANEGARVLLPVHPNPNVKASVETILKNNKKIHLLPPLTYCDLVFLLSQSRLVITDSGGLQEEGPTLGIPVIVTRDKTERPEGVASGSVLLVGTEYNRVIESAMEVLFNDQTHYKMSTAKNPYGDGTSAKQIVGLIKRHFTQ